MSCFFFTFISWELSFINKINTNIQSYYISWPSTSADSPSLLWSPEVITCGAKSHTS